MMNPVGNIPSPSPRTERVLGMLVLVWAGLVIGISFIEAPVKFTAPSLTLPVGLDVGRRVFGALNLAELFLATVSVALMLSIRPRRSAWVAMGVVWMALLLQTLWLLPALDARAVMIIGGGRPETSAWPLHLLYGLAEGGKVLALLSVGWMLSQTRPSPERLTQPRSRKARSIFPPTASIPQPQTTTSR